MSPSANLLSSPVPVLDGLAVEVRELTVADLDCGFLESLSSLTEVDLSPEEALPLFHERLTAGILTYVACIGAEVVGTASLLIERKFIHRGALVGHVEDVAVRRDVQRSGIGTALMQHVTAEARRRGCYKVILNCLDDRVGFYTRLGYHCKDNGLRYDC